MNNVIITMCDFFLNKGYCKHVVRVPSATEGIYKFYHIWIDKDLNPFFETEMITKYFAELTELGFLIK